MEHLFYASGPLASPDLLLSGEGKQVGNSDIHIHELHVREAGFSSIHNKTKNPPHHYRAQSQPNTNVSGGKRPSCFDTCLHH